MNVGAMVVTSSIAKLCSAWPGYWNLKTRAMWYNLSVLCRFLKLAELKLHIYPVRDIILLKRLDQDAVSSSH